MNRAKQIPSAKGPRLRWLAFAALSLTLCGCIALITPNVKTELYELRSGDYKVDKTHTTVLFKVNHMGLSTYVGRFNELDASLNFDPENLEQSSLQATVKTASVDVNNQALEATLSGSDWFNSDRYPEMIFSTSDIQLIDGSTLSFTGELTLLGVSQPIEMVGVFHGGATNLLTGRYTLGFSASGQAKRSDFGMDQYIGIVGDEVSFEIYAEFQKQ